jgi:GT2 family glycosyltransferase
VSASRAPVVQALVPTWRAAAFLEATLDALAAQTWGSFRVLVSDDASPDATAAIAEARAVRDPRFRVIRQGRNLGWVGNVNALLEAADPDADLLLFAFQDDLPAPDYVERCVRALVADPDAVLAFSDVLLVSQDGSREEKRYAVLEGIADPIERARRIARQESSWWIPNRGVFRAGAAGAIGGLRRHAAGEFSADWPWLFELSLLGSFVRIPEPLVTKIYLPTSLSRSWRFGARQWLAVTASARSALRRRGVRGLSRWRLEWALAAFALSRIHRSLRRRTGRARRMLLNADSGR